MEKKPDGNGGESAITHSNSVDRGCARFLGLKELAHRFCLSFGPEASVKSREAIVAIHQEAIKYVHEYTELNAVTQSASASKMNTAVAPANLLFLEVIVEFSSRLTAQDKRVVLAELDRTFAKRANKIEANNWQSYYTYRIRYLNLFSTKVTKKKHFTLKFFIRKTL